MDNFTAAAMVLLLAVADGAANGGCDRCNIDGRNNIFSHIIINNDSLALLAVFFNRMPLKIWTKPACLKAVGRSGGAATSSN